MAIDTLSGLDAPARARLEGILVGFDLNWGPDELPAAVAGLPADEPVRRAALVELVKIDLERQWRAGRPALVEDYVRRFPALGPDTAALVRAEIEARGQAGVAAPRDEFHRRFPDLFSSDGAPTLPAPNPTEVEATPPAAPLPERFGRYHILRPLGRGGMGAVYLARDTELDRLVALKVPNLETGDPEAAGRFAREARAAATIEHPNVCRVYDVGRIDGRQYLTMAFVDGRTLADTMRETPPGPRAAVELVRTVARAVAEAHRRGVVHRDLKPGNILMTAGGEPVVTDFGLARRESATDPRLTETGMALGTPLYMSPEQMTGDTARVGPASDVYSLGVVLYELLAGRTPFGTTRSTLFMSTLTETPPGPSRVRPGVDPGLDNIVLKALEKLPEGRYPTMVAFADALDQWLTGKQERKPGPWLWLVLLAVVALVLVAIPVACNLGWLSKPTTSPTTRPVIGPKEQGDPHTPPDEPKLAGSGAIPDGKERYVAIAFGPDPDTLFTATAPDDTEIKLRRWGIASGKEQAAEHGHNYYNWAAFAPDGHRVLTGGIGTFAFFHTTADFNTVQQFDIGPHQNAGGLARNSRRAIMGLEQLFGGYRVRVYDTLTGVAVGEYAGHPDKILAVALSDDGTWAASASGKHFAVREVGPNTVAIGAGSNSIRSLAFLPNAGRLAVGTEAGDIAVYDVATKGRVREFQPGHPTAVNHLAVSTTGVLVSGGADGTVRVWDPETGKERIATLTIGKGPVGCVAVSPDGKRAAAGSADQTWRVWELP